MHLGRQWPRQFKNFVPSWHHMAHALGPSRKMKHWVVNWHSPTPTVELLWVGLTVVSELPEYWPSDESWLEYETINPDDSLAVLKTRTRLEWAGTTHANAWNYEWVLIVEAFYNAVFLGRCEVRRDEPTSPWINPSSEYRTPNDWSDLTDPAQFRGLGINLGAANWADQPEYHPYRHEP